MSDSKQLSIPVPNTAYRFHPSQLKGKQRMDHVVDSLKTYNHGIIMNNPRGANLKFEKLMNSPFIFMRGTADLMYRDFVGTDADQSMVLCVGDVHVENFGVMEANDGALIWGINDFDEAQFAPFSWDVKRGATSIILAATDMQREKVLSKKKAIKLAKAFAKSYLRTIQKHMEEENYTFSFGLDTSPDIIRDLLKTSDEIKEKKYLKKHFLDPENPKPVFRNTDEIERIEAADQALIDEIQQSLNRYLKILQAQYNHAPEGLTLLDVATKTGSGTGSIGLWRYYALVEITKKGKSTQLILELKQERASVLAPYVGGGLLLFPSEGSRVAYAENVQTFNANPYYGYTQIKGTSYLVRKKSPHKMRVKTADLNDYQSFKDYVKACGKALALAHLQSDSILLEVYEDIATSILHSVNPATFSKDIAGFASKMAEQVRQDWEYFREAYQEYEFTFSE